MYGLTAEDLRIRDTAREFVETLIPYEAEAEEAGQLPRRSPPNTTPAPSSWACTPHQHADLGRGPIHGAATGSGAGAGRPGDQRDRVGVSHAAQWWPRWPPTIRRSAGCCPRYAGRNAGGLRHHRGVRRLGRLRAEATARRDGDEYVINGVKWHHLVQPGRLCLRPGRADRRTAPGRPRAAGGRPALAGVEVVRTPHYSHSIPDEHPIVSPSTCGCRRPTWWAPRARA